MAAHPASSRAENPPQGEEDEDSPMSREGGEEVTQNVNLPLLTPHGPEQGPLACQLQGSLEMSGWVAVCLASSRQLKC